MQELISVIVPIYGIERYVGQCIESILNQTYNNLEIILVDDGSTDRCPEICDLYAGKDLRIKVIHKKNGGLVSARKAGLLAATGRYVGYVDGDDWVGKDFYQKLYDAISSCGADVAVSGFKRDLFDKSEIILNNAGSGIYSDGELKCLLNKMMSCGAFYQNGVTTYLWNKLFKRELLISYQMVVDDGISIGEDAAVVYPLMTACKKVVITSDAEYHYRQREDSMLKRIKPFSEEKKGLRVLYKYLKDFYSVKSSEYDYIGQLNEFVLSICIMRSGGIDVESEFHVPYVKDFKNKKVAIYSAGTFGQQLVNRINEKEYCKIVAWVDDDYWEYRRCCLDVDPVESLDTRDFDYVLVASINSLHSREVKGRLISQGVEEDKILTVNCRDSDKEKLLRKYLN